MFCNSFLEFTVMGFIELSAFLLLFVLMALPLTSSDPSFCYNPFAPALQNNVECLAVREVLGVVDKKKYRLKTFSSEELRASYVC